MLFNTYLKIGLFLLLINYKPIYAQKSYFGSEINEEKALAIVKDSIWIKHEAWKSLMGWCYGIDHNNPICKINTDSKYKTDISFEILPICSFDTSKLNDFSFEQPLSKYLKISDGHFYALIIYKNIKVGTIYIFKKNNNTWYHRIIDIYDKNSKWKVTYNKINKELKIDKDSIFSFQINSCFHVISYFKNDTMYFGFFDGEIKRAKEYIKSITTVEHIKKYARGDVYSWIKPPE